MRLAERHTGPTVVITHHPPSTKSIHPRFADSLMNGANENPLFDPNFLATVGQ